MRKFVLTGSLVVGLLAGLACSSDPDPVPPGADAGATGTDASSAGSDASSGPTICEENATLATSPNAISVATAALASAPTPAGGAISNGTYSATKITWYTDSSAKPQANYKATLKFVDQAWVWIRKSGWNPTGAEPADADSHRGGGTYTVTGTKIAFTSACGQTSPPSDPTDYTASGNTYLTFMGNGLSGADYVLAVTTYTKQ